MNRPWPSDAVAFEESVGAALKSLGGVEFTRECEADPERRHELRATLESLELLELSFAAGEVEAAAIALACKAAGRVVAPWPLVEQLAARAGADPELSALYLVSDQPRRAAHLDLAGPALAYDVRSGTATRIEPAGPVSHMPIDPFGVPCRVAGGAELAAEPFGVHTVLSAFWVLGALETSVELASAYSIERYQFGRPIASFGAIQWRLSDLAVSSSALAELAAFTLGKLIDSTVTRADLFSLRLQMLESAKPTLADAHQVFGAIGLCEEHDLAVIDRHLQGALRRPAGSERTGLLLADRVRAEGYDSLYPVGPTVAAETTNR